MKSFLQKALVVLLFLNLMGVMQGLSDPNMSETDVQNVSTALHLPVILSEGVVYFGFLLILISRMGRFYRAIGAMKSLMILTVFCCASTVWSTDPNLTVRRSLVLAFTTLTALLIGQEYDLKGIVRLLGVAFTIHIALVIVLLVVAPTYVIDHAHLGSIKGLSGHKNLFGMQMGIAALCFMFSPPLRNYRWSRYLFVLVALGLAIGSQSAGSIIAMVAGFVTMPIWRVFRLSARIRYPAVIAILLVFAAFALYAVQNVEDVLAVFSKNSTFSGRTQVWILVLAAISRHPLLGVGFDAFWEGLKGGSLSVISGAGWFVPTAHNGYLDLILSIGVVGAVLFSFVLVRGVKLALNALLSEPSDVCYVPIVFIPMWLTYNMVESSLVARTQIPYMFFICVSTSIALRYRQSPKQTERLQPSTRAA